MRKFFILIIFLSSRAIFSQSLNNKILRIEPDNSRGAGVAQIFDTVNYIPLETTAESLFGEIYQLEVTDKYFIILDRNTNSILLFDKNGEFHSKIKGGDQSFPGNVIRNFFVDIEKKQIMFKLMRTMLYYDFNGKKTPLKSLGLIKEAGYRF